MNNPLALTEAYNLTPPLDIRPEDGYYTVLTPDGDYILKVYAASEGLESARYEHWLLMALQQTELRWRLPIPIRDVKGATFHQDTASDDVWVLTPLLRGTPMTPNDPYQAYAVGVALATLHQALATVQALPHPLYGEYSLHNRVLPSLRGDLPDEVKDLGLSQTPEGFHRLKRFRLLAQEYQAPPPTPNHDRHWHIVHGDFFGGNLLYDGESINGILDFKSAHPDYRAREFAETMMRVANDFGSLFWGTARSFVDGYAEILQLTATEIDLVPRFVVESHVDRVIYHSKTPRAAHMLRVQEDISAWSEIETKRLVAMLRGVFLGE